MERRRRGRRPPPAAGGSSRVRGAFSASERLTRAWAGACASRACSPRDSGKVALPVSREPDRRKGRAACMRRQSALQAEAGARRLARAFVEVPRSRATTSTGKAVAPASRWQQARRGEGTERYPGLLPVEARQAGAGPVPFAARTAGEAEPPWAIEMWGPGDRPWTPVAGFRGLRGPAWEAEREAPEGSLSQRGARGGAGILNSDKRITYAR